MLALPDSECTGASFLMAEGMSHLVAFVYPNHPQQEQTAEVAETEPMSGEIVASMIEQQEITIKDLQKEHANGRRTSQQTSRASRANAARHARPERRSTPS